MESRAVVRYVKSLLGLAEERNVLDEVHNDMLLFSKVCDQNPEFVVILKSPVIRHDLKRQILDKVFSGKVNALTLAFFNIITKKNREPLLQSIAREFHRAYNTYKGIGKATVTTAFAIDSGLRDQIESMVKKISKTDKIELEEKIDAEMIGGFVLKVGDRQIDASLRSKLNSLKIGFSQNPYAKGF
jgi:F-type H+-transporting ATPase subunit delta